MKLADKAKSKTHRVCVFGPPKCGKSELVAKLAEHFNLLWIDFENGYAILYKMPEDWQARVELILIPDTRTFPIGIQTALKIVTGAKMKICNLHGNVACAICASKMLPSTEICLNDLDNSWIVVYDSLTQIGNSAMAHLTKNQTDEYKPDWEDYRNQGTLLDKFLSQVQQAKYNVVCITHEAEVEMEDGTKKLVPVSGTTNFSRNTAKYFDHVIYGKVANRKHEFSSSTIASTKVLTGSRTDVAIEDDATPTLLRIFKPEVLPPVPAKNPIGTTTAASPTPGATSLSNLEEIKRRMAAK